MSLADSLALIGIATAILAVGIPAVWKKVRWNEIAELRRIYSRATKEVKPSDKNLRQLLKAVVEEQEFWLKARSESVPYTHERDFFCKSFRVLTELSDEEIEAISGSFYSSVYDGLAKARNDCWRERAHRWDKERSLSPLPPPSTLDSLVPNTVGVFSLPPLPKGFVDRGETLSTLKHWLEEDEEKTVLSIVGLAGRGKTCVASKLFCEAQQSGQWEARWVDCSSVSVTLDSLLMSLAQEWQEQIDAAAPYEDNPYYQQLTNAAYPYESRLDALIRWLERKQWLLVLDNYPHVGESLDELVIAVDQKAARTRLLLVGRREPAVLRESEIPTGADESLSLDPLPQAYALDYLAKWRHLQGLSVEQAQAIWEKCSGEPEAMKQFAYATRRKSVNELLLMELPNWSEGTKEWLDELTEILTDSERRALSAACIFSGPHERALLESVCAANAANEIGGAIEGLIDARLLELDAGYRLSLHSILRDYWRNRLGDDAKGLHACAAAWLEEQRGVITNSQGLPNTQDRNESVHEQWADYTRRAFDHWREAGEPLKALACAENLWAVTKDARGLCQQALEVCEAGVSELSHANWLRREAALLYQDQKTDEAYERYCHSLRLYIQLGDKLGQAQTEAALSYLYYEGGAYGDAYTYARSSLSLSEQLGDKLTQAASLHVLGLVDELHRNFTEALTSLTKAHALLVEVGAESGELEQDTKRVKGEISMRTILTTVGTSLLANAKRDLKTEQLDDQQLADYLRNTDPTRSSAEANSLSRLLSEGDDRIVFLRSQTEEGRRCAEVLLQHYDNAGYQSREIEVPDLNYVAKGFKMRGLRSLVATLIKQIREAKAEGRSVAINATGGFKAEIAYATLVGLLFDVPVYYIHEAFRDIIEMPPIPISWDYSLLADHEDLFDWINQDLRSTVEVDSRLNGLPEEARRKIALLLTSEEGYELLSPSGEAFYEAYLDKKALQRRQRANTPE